MENKITCAMVSLALSDAHKKRIEDAMPGTEILYVDAKNAAEVNSALARADVAIVGGKVTDAMLGAPNLRWVHCDAAGLDPSARPEVIASKLIVTGSAGRSAPALAEHVFYFMFSFAYDVRALEIAQKNRQWGGFPGMNDQKALFSQTIGILGYGNSGVALAERAKAFGMRVLAYRRADLPTPENVDRMYSEQRGEGIDELLTQSDFVAVTLPLNDATHNLIGARELALMKNTAVLINIGRGAVIDETALIAALNSGEIAGAGLDTFCEEPLSANNPIWSAKNLMVTPHFTPPCPDKIGRSLDIVIENIGRFRRGEALRNRLLPEDVFNP